MSIREQIQNLIEKRPGIKLEELKKKLPDVKEATLRTYFVKIKKNITSTKEKKPTVIVEKAQPEKSIRQRVLDYLNKNPNTSLEDLLNTFKKEKRRTIETYFYPWQREKAKKSVTKIQTTKKSPGKEESLQSKLFAYLDKHPDASPATLRVHFSDKNKRTLLNMAYLWRKSKKTIEKLVAKTKKITEPQITEKSVAIAPVSSDKELVQALRNTIAAQEKTIEALNESILLIKRKA